MAACSLTTSLSGLAGPPEDDAAASADVNADAAADSRAHVDASDAADAAPVVPYCQTVIPTPVFCDDFERTTPQGTWSSLIVGGGGVITTAPSTRGAGRELRSVIPVFSGGGVSEAKLRRTFADSDVVTLSYSLRIDAAPTQGEQQAMVLMVTYPGSVDFFEAYLFVRPDGVKLVEQTFPGGGVGTGSIFKEHALTPAISFGSWQRIELTATLFKPPRLRLTIDGKVAFEGPADPFFRPGKPSVSAGIHYANGPSGPLSVRVDDLFLTLK